MQNQEREKGILYDNVKCLFYDEGVRQRLETEENDANDLCEKNNIAGMNFTYHPQLYHNHASWINDIFPIVKLLVSSFPLKFIYLFSHLYITNPCQL